MDSNRAATAGSDGRNLVADMHVSVRDYEADHVMALDLGTAPIAGS
jgi:hypothetical protein